MASKVLRVERTISAIRKVKDRVGKGIEDATRQSLEIIGNRSDALCPKDTLELVKSKKVTITGRGTGTKGRIEYTAPHAVPVHEDLEKKHAEPTQAKFLETASREMRGVCASATKRIVKVQ